MSTPQPPNRGPAYVLLLILLAIACALAGAVLGSSLDRGIL